MKRKITVWLSSTQFGGEQLTKKGERVRSGDNFDTLIEAKAAVKLFVKSIKPKVLLNDGFGTTIIASIKVVDLEVVLDYKDSVSERHVVLWRSRPKMTKRQVEEEQRWLS